MARVTTESTQTPLASTTAPARSRVSRETRQLLTAALVALVALWVLARIRFPDQPATPSPIPSLLSQLSPVPRFANLAGEIAELNTRLSSSWIMVPIASWDPSGPVNPMRPAIRLQDDRAILLLRPGDRLAHDQHVALDRATGLTVIERPADPRTGSFTTWTPPSIDGPRYLMITATTMDGVSLRPVFIGSMTPRRSPAWSGPIWSVPGGSDLDAGSFVVTTDGELAGVVVQDPAGPAIVPAEVLIADAQRLIARGLTRSIDLGLQLQPLTDALSAATGAQMGLGVAWVEPTAITARRIHVGDVIETINGRPLASVSDWEVVTNRLPAAGVTLRVWRAGEHVDVALAPGDLGHGASTSPLGVTLTPVNGGSMVERVAEGTAADAIPLLKGDVITRAGAVDAPGPDEIARLFESLKPGEAILLAITRGSARHVAGLVK